MSDQTLDRPVQGGALLGVDIGSQRIGVALARGDVRIPQPLLTLEATDDPAGRLAALVREHGVACIVAGWPRGLDGQSTAQTAEVEAFVSELRNVVNVPVELQDEALTSRKAEAELKSRGKPYAKQDIDALAATYILEDYLSEHAGEFRV
jgi:putative Holliday junction resolvase